MVNKYKKYCSLEELEYKLNLTRHSKKRERLIKKIKFRKSILNKVRSYLKLNKS